MPCQSLLRDESSQSLRDTQVVIGKQSLLNRNNTKLCSLNIKPNYLNMDNTKQFYSIGMIQNIIPLIQPNYLNMNNTKQLHSIETTQYIILLNRSNLNHNYPSINITTSCDPIEIILYSVIRAAGFYHFASLLFL